MRARKYMLKILVSLMIAISCCAGAWGEIAAAKNLNKEQSDALSDIFSRAESNDIPSEILESKLAEGLTKSVEFPEILKALEQKLSSLMTAKKITNTAKSVGMRITSYDYCLKVLSDLLEDGMSPRDIEEFVNIAFVGGKKLDYALRATEIYYGYSKYLPKNDLKQIFTVMIARDAGVNKIEKIFQIALDASRENIPWRTLKDLMMENIASDRSPQQLRNQIQNRTDNRATAVKVPPKKFDAGANQSERGRRK